MTDGGIKPGEERLGAISEFPTQSDTYQLHSFLGLANQLLNFLPDLAVGTVKIRGLLRKRTGWVWTPGHEKEFVAVKKLLTSATIARYIDPQLESKLLTDASRSWISFALIQEGLDGQKRLITCGSLGLNSAEVRYAPVELECLGVVYTIQKCAFYIMGARKLFTVVTDHKPLLGEFNKPLSETPNPRLQRLRLKVVVAKVQLTCKGGRPVPGTGVGGGPAGRRGTAGGSRFCSCFDGRGCRSCSILHHDTPVFPHIRNSRSLAF